MSRDDLETVITVPVSDPRFGRNVVHDRRSRNFVYSHDAAGVRPSTAFRHRVYGPTPVPNQPIGCCTGVDQAVKADTAGNRIPGVILGMDYAIKAYSLATTLDDAVSPGQYPPDDTGSSGLYACKASKQLGIIDAYQWVMAGADAVLQTLIDHPVGVGTWWYQSMMETDPDTGLVDVSGPKVGGHQWTLIGWRPELDAFEGMCWWGPDFGHRGVFRIKRTHLGDLLADDGDAHITHRAKKNR